MAILFSFRMKYTTIKRMGIKETFFKLENLFLIRKIIYNSVIQNSNSLMVGDLNLPFFADKASRWVLQLACLHKFYKLE